MSSDVGAVGSVTLTLATSCDHCAQPIPINGPVKVARCPHCAKATPVPHLYEIVRAAAKRTREPAEYQYAWFDDRGPECPRCGMDVRVDLERTGAAMSIACRCGGVIPTYPAPDWLKRHLPTALQIFGGDGDVAREVGVELEVDQHADQPIALACPSCGGGLSVTRNSERTIGCTFCAASVFVPDELWKRLHPAKTMVRWTITYRGELLTDAQQGTHDDIDRRVHDARATLVRARAAVAKVAAARPHAIAARPHAIAARPHAIAAAPHPDVRAPEATASDDIPASAKRRAAIGRDVGPPRRASALLLLLVIPIALMAMGLTLALVPASKRLVAPLACPADYSRSLVVRHTAGTSRGGTQYWSDLWCVFPDPKRPPVAAHELPITAAMFGLWLVLVTAFAIGLRARLGRRRRA